MLLSFFEEAYFCTILYAVLWNDIQGVQKDIVGPAGLGRDSRFLCGTSRVLERNSIQNSTPGRRVLYFYHENLIITNHIHRTRLLV